MTASFHRGWATELNHLTSHLKSASTISSLKWQRKQYCDSFSIYGLLLAHPWLWHFIQQLELPLARSERTLFLLFTRGIDNQTENYNREIMDNDTEKGIKRKFNVFRYSLKIYILLSGPDNTCKYTIIINVVTCIIVSWLLYWLFLFDAERQSKTSIYRDTCRMLQTIGTKARARSPW